MAKPKSLFLGYHRGQTSLIQFLENQGHDVSHDANPRENLGGFEYVISYGYRHILSEKLIQTADTTPINLHTSYLPFNRGAHPNFWSWIDDTPRGVTIHAIDAGLDTGPIYAQEQLLVERTGLTFAKSYEMLHDQIEGLFKSIFPNWSTGGLKPAVQTGKGSYHNAGQLPEWMQDWNMQIGDAIQRYKAST